MAKANPFASKKAPPFGKKAAGKGKGKGKPAKKSAACK